MNSEDLMLGYCHGNEASFEALYKRVAPRLGGYLRRVLRDGTAAEDVLQQTFVKVHLARAAYIPGADPLPWLYTIAHRTCLDELRQRRRTPIRLGESGEHMEPAASFAGQAGFCEPHEAFEPAERERVIAALDCLTVEQRTALVLTKLQGKSLAEAASEQGISVGAIKLRAHRARRRLQARLRTERLTHGGTP